VIVACPSCHTRYRTDSSHIIDETTRFQCTKEECGHVFYYSPPLLEGARPEPTPLASSLRPAAHLTTPLSIPEDILTIPADEPQLEDEPVLTKPLDLPEGTSFDQAELAEAFVPTDAPFYADDEAAENEQGATFEAPVWLEPEKTIASKTFFLLLVSLVFSNGLLGLYCFHHPEGTEAVLARLPILGSLVAGERFSAQHIVLDSLEGRYQTTKDNQKVFTVSGTATNNATIPARTIQIEGIIYDEKGKIVGQRLIFCGTNIAPDRLTNLTLREIGALQDLVPPKQFHIVTGNTVKFLIVFTTPPSSVAEFSGRVVAAQFGSL
jgi:predicted Zn finger-like uncharacterized protein